MQPVSRSQDRINPGLLGRRLSFHSTTVGRCSNEPLQMQADTKKTQLGVSACMPACLTASLADCQPN